MAAHKKYSELENSNIYPSNINTIEVDNTNEFTKSHNYRVKLSEGYDSTMKDNIYSDKTVNIKFVGIDDNNKIIPGLQSEQLILIVLDRVKKLNNKFPSNYNEEQIKGLEMYLNACKKRIENRLERKVYGKLEK